jgi:aryl-alcohol dehydrogenase
MQILRPGPPDHCEKLFELSFGCARPDGSNAILDQDGHTLHAHFFGQSSFSSFAVASERNVVKVAKEVPIELLGPLCTPRMPPKCHLWHC